MTYDNQCTFQLVGMIFFLCNINLESLAPDHESGSNSVSRPWSWNEDFFPGVLVQCNGFEWPEWVINGMDG